MSALSFGFVRPADLARLFAIVSLVVSSGVLADSNIRVERKADAFSIYATICVDAPAGIAWETLTDYANLARFVPGLSVSEVTSAPDEPLRVRQVGQSGFALVRSTVDVTVQIEEQPMREIRFFAVGGNVKNKAGKWLLDPRENYTVIVYQADIEPGFWIPTLLGAAVMAQDIGKKMLAVADEVMRRASVDNPLSPDTFPGGKDGANNRNCP